MEAGVFYGDTHSTKLSHESDTFTDKEHPPPTQAGKKKSAFKKSHVPFSLPPALSCPSFFPILILEHLHNYLSFPLGLVFIKAGSPPSGFHFLIKFFLRSTLLPGIFQSPRVHHVTDIRKPFACRN